MDGVRVTLTISLISPLCALIYPIHLAATSTTIPQLGQVNAWRGHHASANQRPAHNDIIMVAQFKPRQSDIIEFSPCYVLLYTFVSYLVDVVVCQQPCGIAFVT